MGRFDQTVTQDGAPGYQVHTRPNRQVAWTEGATRQVRVIEGPTIVGAAPEVDLVLCDPAVSRFHAELDLHQGGLRVRDLDSRNGTFVEGVRVGSAWVPDGGKLRLGGTELMVSYGNQPTAVELWPQDRFGSLIGPSLPMRELFARLARIAKSESTVLIQGETGTGKDLVAHELHDQSPRAGGPFGIVDCGALPETLLESELFGHAKGAFTGAVQARAGVIEAADGGTVFLDEIGDLPLGMQPKLLRVLESRTVRRLGESEPRPVNVRFISATHHDLQRMVSARAFREDLYFRLAVLPVTVPPLRERPSDIVALVHHFLPPEALAAVTPEIIRELTARPWLGNVRELRTFIERSQTLGQRAALAMSATGPGTVARISLPAEMLALPYKEVRERVLNQVERDYVRGLLERHANNISAAAEAAGINRGYMHRLVHKHDLR